MKEVYRRLAGFGSIGLAAAVSPYPDCAEVNKARLSTAVIAAASRARACSTDDWGDLSGAYAVKGVSECARNCTKLTTCSFWTGFTSGTKDCYPLAFPECAVGDAAYDGDGTNVWFDAMAFGSDEKLGCYQADCSWTDTFAAREMEECAAVCAGVPDCAFWSYTQSDDSDGRGIGCGSSTSWGWSGIRNEGVWRGSVGDKEAEVRAGTGSAAEPLWLGGIAMLTCLRSFFDGAHHSSSVAVGILSMDPLIPGMVPAPAGGVPRIYTSQCQVQQQEPQQTKAMGDESTSQASTAAPTAYACSDPYLLQSPGRNSYTPIDGTSISTPTMALSPDRPAEQQQHHHPIVLPFREGDWTQYNSLRSMSQDNTDTSNADLMTRRSRVPSEHTEAFNIRIEDENERDVDEAACLSVEHTCGWPSRSRPKMYSFFGAKIRGCW
ncbi:hypothetical protein FOZ60_003474 [Perkinsus olseni]|uniref:Uncharacterized protein n=1 Tax=Perkinsus olseni TaxID=32597 RepID=A0A7J6NVI0_PEROL|nr:hypothetical protein FOZ60_003474 [Perkinsus olseni]